mmetsp:Transcript_81916/g.236879  ORF Transcript_81916/g.236879 Transcript_81916/m.236879 type:complete len:143 (-) Transcript_81916:268-696(-)
MFAFQLGGWVRHAKPLQQAPACAVEAFAGLRPPARGGDFDDGQHRLWMRLAARRRIQKGVTMDSQREGAAEAEPASHRARMRSWVAVGWVPSSSRAGGPCRFRSAAISGVAPVRAWASPLPEPRCSRLARGRAAAGRIEKHF